MSRCRAFEAPRGGWTVNPMAQARESAFHSALTNVFTNRSFHYAYRSSPTRDFADCVDDRYKWHFVADPSSCLLPPWEELRSQLLKQLAGKTIVFAGDSLVRQLYNGLRNALIMDSVHDGQITEVSVGTWNPDAFPKWTAGRLNEADASEFHTPFGPLRLRFFPVYMELFYAKSFVNTAWVDSADVLVIGLGAFAHEASVLETALASWSRALEAYEEARHSKDLAPLRIIWKEYTPAHFPPLVRPATDAPGETTWPIPNELRHKLLKDDTWCTNENISLEQARSNFRLTLVERTLNQRALASHGSRPSWELLPLFDAMWERPEMHAMPRSTLDCRHWCQFSSVMDHWVQTFANGLTRPPVLRVSPSHETLANGLTANGLTHAAMRHSPAPPPALQASPAPQPPRAALCYVGSVRTGVLPPVHRSVAAHLIGPWVAAGIAVDPFIFVSVADSYGHGAHPMTCMPERTHVDSLLQTLRPVHAEFTRENTCAAVERAAQQHNVTIEAEAASDCCASTFRERYGTQKDFARQHYLAAGKQVDFLQLASIKICFAAADAYAQRHEHRYSHYVRLRPDFAFFRAVPPVPLEGRAKVLVTNPDWNALASDIFFVLPAELKRSWWDSRATSLACTTVTRHVWPLEYNLFPSPGLPASLVAQNRSIFGGLVRTSGFVHCVRDKHDVALRNVSGHVPCSPTSVDGLDGLPTRVEHCAVRPDNESELLVMMYESAAWRSRVE